MPVCLVIRRFVNYWAVLVTMGALTVSPVFAQGPDKKQQERLEEAQRAEAQVLVGEVDELAKGGEVKSALPLEWEQHHFIKALGDKTYVPFTLAVDGAALPAGTAVALYLRVVDRGGAAAAAPDPAADAKKKEKAAESRPEYPFEDLFFFELPASTEGQPHRIRRAFAVPPGEYDVFVALRERASAGTAAGASGGGQQSAAAPAGEARLASVRQSLSVPSFTTPQLTTSSIIVAQSVDVLQTPLPEERQADNPYTFGQMRITPAPDHAFTKKDELSLVFWIYGAATDSTTNKPNVMVEFKFHQRQGEKETYFNKTDPQALNAETLPPQFDLSAGHQLPGSLAVPLASFPEGDYRLEIELADKIANQTITRDVSFTVAGQ